MSFLASLWWRPTGEPPKNDEATARAAEQSAAEHAELARRFAGNPGAGVLDDMPRHVAILERTLHRRSQRGIFRLVYRAKLVIPPAEFRSGTLAPQLVVRCELLHSNMVIQQALELKVRCIALSMEVVESDARALPFSIVWRATPQCAVVAAAGEHWAAAQRRGSKRHVPTKTLLSTPVGVENLSLNISFTSFEAVGFDATRLMQNIAELTPSGAYRIPITYIYSGLLRNVHSACVLAEQRATLSPLEVETAPVSTYQVAHDDQHMLMSGEDLQRAVAYIEKSLVPTNYDFNFAEPELLVEPFGGGKWLDAWQRALGNEHNRAAVAGQLASVDAPSPPVAASIVFVVYVGAVPENGYNNGFAMPMLPASISVATRPRRPPRRAPNNDDDGDDTDTDGRADVTDDGERRDMASGNGVMTMELAGGSVSEEDNAGDSETEVRDKSLAATPAAPVAT